MAQRPIAAGLVLCEQVIVEESTRNVTLVNSFTQRKVDGFPTAPQPLVVFSMLTDGLGDIELETLFHRLDNFAEVANYRVVQHFANPLTNYRFLLRIRNLSFPVAGYYQVSLLADREVIAQRRFLVHLGGQTHA